MWFVNVICVPKVIFVQVSPLPTAPALIPKTTFVLVVVFVSVEPMSNRQRTVPAPHSTGRANVIRQVFVAPSENSIVSVAFVQVPLAATEVATPFVYQTIGMSKLRTTPVRLVFTPAPFSVSELVKAPL